MIGVPRPRSNNRPDSYRTLTGNEWSKVVAEEDNGLSIALVPGKGWGRNSHMVEVKGGFLPDRDVEKGEMHQSAGDIGVKRDVCVSSHMVRR